MSRLLLSIGHQIDPSCAKTIAIELLKAPFEGQSDETALNQILDRHFEHVPRDLLKKIIKIRLIQKRKNTELNALIREYARGSLTDEEVNKIAASLRKSTRLRAALCAAVLTMRETEPDPADTLFGWLNRKLPGDVHVGPSHDREQKKSRYDPDYPHE